MRFNAAIRKLHYWVSIAIALPALVLMDSGPLLQTKKHWSWVQPTEADLIESIHDGSFFGGDWTKLGVFLPTGLLLFFLWGSGLILFWIPLAVKRKRDQLRADLTRPV